MIAVVWLLLRGLDAGRESEGVEAKGRNSLVAGEKKRCDEWECERGRDDGRWWLEYGRAGKQREET